MVRENLWDSTARTVRPYQPSGQAVRPYLLIVIPREQKVENFVIILRL